MGNAVRREEADEQKNDSRLNFLSYKGAGATCRRASHYQQQNLKTTVSVGLTRSAASARFPICGILAYVGIFPGGDSELSHVANVSFLRIINAPEYQKGPWNCRGICVNHDETSTKLNFCDNGMKTLNFTVRRIAIFKEGGRRINYMPEITSLHSKRALGIFGWGLNIID